MANIIEPERGALSGGPGLSYRLAGKFVNQPLAMHAGAAQQLKSAIDARAFDAETTLNLGTGASKFIGARDQAARYRVTEDGFALVPVHGTLIDRGEFLGDMGGWMTSYEGLAEQFRRLAKDDAIKGVILDIDSPGGMVAGLFDLLAELGKLSKKKRVTAVAANMAASAAYAIGCAADELFVTRSGLAGSIGVIAMHTSFARALDQGGIDVTIIYDGDHKADGNPYQALSHGARAEMAASIDAFGAQFRAHVAKARGMDDADVRALQARCFTGSKAVEAGLADGIKSFEEVLEYLRKDTAKKPGASGKPQKTGVRTMSDQTPAAGQPDINAIIAAAVAGINAGRTAPAAAAPAPAAVAPAAAAAAPDAAEAERARVFGILQHPEADGRHEQAVALAKSGLSIDAAVEVLKASPKAAAAQANPLAALMRQPGNTAAVRPESTGAPTGGAGAQPSLAQKFAARHSTAKR